MKIKCLATGIAPDYYEINGDVITVYNDGVSEVYDFSGVPADAGEITVSDFNGMRAIRKVEMIDGELHVQICQRVGAGNWSESDWFDASQYDPNKRYVIFDETKSFTGIPVFWTKAGKQVLGE